MTLKFITMAVTTLSKQEARAARASREKSIDDKGEELSIPQPIYQNTSMQASVNSRKYKATEKHFTTIYLPYPTGLALVFPRYSFLLCHLCDKNNSTSSTLDLLLSKCRDELGLNNQRFCGKGTLTEDLVVT